MIGRPHTRDALWIGLAAVVLEGLFSGLDLGVTGSVGMGAPLLGMVVAVVVGMALRARQDPDWLTRASLKRLAVGIALVHFVCGGALGASVPHSAVAARGLSFVAAGLLMGLGAFVVALCAGDAVAMVYCPFPDASGPGSTEGPTGPWRRR